MARQAFSQTHPQLVPEWHPTKNLPLTPDSVTRGSKLKIWWVCPVGHEYQSMLITRCVQGSGCSYCSGNKTLTGFNDLATKFPAVAKEFHPTKNLPDTAQTVSPASFKKYWWICPLGHEYDANSANRTNNGAGCPFCSGNKVLRGFNDLETKRPDIAKQWHAAKNTLRPFEVTFGAATKVWWQCPDDSEHIWEASVNRRTGYGHEVGCPYCGRQKVLEGNNDLATSHPEVVKLWHPTLNGDLSPSSVLSGSNFKVWWICAEYPDHVFEMRVNSKLNGRHSGCPICSNKLVIKGINDLQTTNPEIAALWHPELNGKLGPDEVSYGSNKKVWWLCEKGHVTYSSPATRINREKRCAVCSNQQVLAGYNDLETTNPEFARQWHPTLNGDLKPSQVIGGSSKKYWWQCDVDERHHWKAAPAERRRRPGCSICSGKQVQSGVNDLATLNPELASQWHQTKNGSLTPSDVTNGSSKSVWWQCDNDQSHIWRAAVSSRSGGFHTGCPTCSKTGFDGSMPGYFYILEHKELSARKVGITNIGVKTDRLGFFQANGWDVLRKFEHDNGYIIIDLETRMLRWIRKDLGLPAYLGKREMKNTGGHSETFAGDGPSNFEVMAKAEEIFEDVIRLHCDGADSAAV